MSRGERGSDGIVVMRRTWLLLTGLLVVAAGGCDAPGTAAAPGGRAADTAEDRAASPRRAAPAPASPAPGTRAPRRPNAAATPSPGELPRVLYLGDSVAVENQDALGDRIRASGAATYTGAPYSGTALCDYLEGRPGKSLVPAKDKAAALVRSLRPDVVVLQFWGNSWGYTPCTGNVRAGTPEYYSGTAADMRAVTKQIARAARDAGAGRPKIVWVLQGPDAISPERVRGLNGVYRDGAAASGDLVADAGREVSMAAYPYDDRPHDRYTWVKHLPCNEHELAHPELCTDPGSFGGVTRMHRDDDLLHFCLAPTTHSQRPCPVRSPGIVRYTGVIAETVLDHLGAREREARRPDAAG